MSITGKYEVESRDNFEAFLAARGVDEAKIKALSDSNVSVTIEVIGDEVKMERVMGPRVVKIDFTLGQEYESVGLWNSKLITELENNKLITKEMGEADSSMVQEFTQGGMIQTMMAKGVTAKMFFKRV